MRIIKFGSFILILNLGIFSMPTMADLTQGLVACYPFDGSASDMSGNENHGTVHGAILVEDRLGKANSAYQFNGVDNYIEVSDSDSLDIKKDITITGWVKVNAYTSSPWLGIVNKADDDSNDTFEVVINNAGRYLHFPLMFEGSGRLAYNSSNNLFGVGEWHFFGVTYNGTNVYIYIDGVLNTSYIAPNQNLNQNSHNLIIGAEREAFNGPHYLDGILDEIRIYNRSLSEDEIVSLYENNEKCTNNWPEYSVLPIFFVPQDWDISSSEVQAEAAAIRSAMVEIRQFYADTLNGRTFRLNELEVLQANGVREDYDIHWNGRNIYEDGIETGNNLEAAVVEELYNRGYPTPPAQNEGGYSVIIFVKGAGGWAGGRSFPNFEGGWAILGDWCIDSLQGQVTEGQYWWSGRSKQTGAVAHELGHTFTLPHPSDNEFEKTIMGAWGNYPNVGFTLSEQESIFTNRTEFFGECWLENPMYFNGVDDIYEIPGSSVKHNYVRKVIVSARVKPEKIGELHTIVSKWYAMDSYMLLLQNNNFTFVVSRPGSQWGIPVSVSIPATLNEWAEVIGIYNGDLGKIKLYVYKDGTLTSTEESVGEGDLQQSERPIAIGNHPEWNAFKGYISNVCLSGDDPSIYSDLDNDGVTITFENAAPNNGDGNGDRIIDRWQPNVTSLPNPVNGNYLTLQATPSTCSLKDVTVKAEEALPTTDPNYSYPYGLIQFKAYCNQANLTVFYHGLSKLPTEYRKYGPTTPGDINTIQWYSLPAVNFNKVTIDSQMLTTASFTLVDGQLGDDTGFDGVISDDGGIAKKSLLAELANFTGTVNQENIHFRWSTDTEEKNAGMNIYCAQIMADTLTETTKVNGKTLIPAKASSYQGTEYSKIYSLTASGIKNGINYCTLEDISTSGESTLHCDLVKAIVVGEQKLSQYVDLEAAKTICQVYAKTHR